MRKRKNIRKEEDNNFYKFYKKLVKTQLKYIALTDVDITCKSSILSQEEVYEVSFKDEHLISISKYDLSGFYILKMAT